MNVIRAKGIPIWVTVLAILIGGMGIFIGVSALLDPTMVLGYVDGADGMRLSWAGRNVGVAVALLVAVLLRNASGYAVAFAASIFREFGDIMATVNGYTDFNVAGMLAFVFVELICLALSVRAALNA
ncbi:MAG: hypothetical protein AAF614_24490 [Chloroflexota bacterium]